MCLVLKDKPEFKVAQRDIYCYKLGVGVQNDTKFYPLYHFEFTYTLNVPTPIEPLVPNFSPDSETSVWEINKEYHSYPLTEQDLPSHVLYLFKIPKGTRYVVGSDNGSAKTAYVSEQLVYLGPLTRTKAFLHLIRLKIETFLNKFQKHEEVQ